MKTSGFSLCRLCIVVLAGLLVPGAVFGKFPCHETGTDHYCNGNGSVTLVAPTNSSIVCLGDSVTVTASVIITNSRTQTITHYDKCDDEAAYGGDAPTYGVTWTASITGSGWSTNGTGLTATFKPPVAGSGTVSFGLGYTNASPCSGTGTSSAGGSFTIVQIVMTNPTGDISTTPIEGQNQFTFSSGNPGVASVIFQAAVFPSNTIALNYASNLVTFSIDSVAGSALSWDPPANGKPKIVGVTLQATAIFSNMPSANSAFGIKLASMSGCISMVTNIGIFFPKNATNHPGGQAGSPNWFYYWKDGGVCGIPTDAIFDSTTSNYGYTRPGIDRILRLGQAAATANNGPETFVSTNPIYGNLTVTGHGKGVQCCGETAAHELFHLTVYDDLQGKADGDGDGVANTTENGGLGINSDSTNPDTYNMQATYAGYALYGDNEIRCRKKELNVGFQIYTNNDWANPGCQSQSKYGPF